MSEAPLPAFYVPWGSQPSAAFTVLVRGDANQNLLSAIGERITNIDKHQPIHRIDRLDSLVADSYGDRRLYAQTTIGLAFVTMAIAASGICGVLIQSISQRRRELGIRFAMGGTSGQIVRLIVGESAKPVFIGIVIGSLFSYQAFDAVKHLLFGVNATDLISFGIAGMSLLIAAVVATVSIGRRLSRLDIVSALRE